MEPPTTQGSSPNQGLYRPHVGALPDRSGVVLGLGIASIVTPLFFAFCCFPMGVVALAFGIPTIVMARADMKKIRDGLAAPTGLQTTQLGLVCGIIGTCLGALFTIATIVLTILYGGILGFALLSQPAY